MNVQQETDLFMAKLAKAVKDTKDDFNKLSPAAQKNVMDQINAILKAKGCAITLEMLFQRRF